jgi:hypothetical protein
LDEAFFILMNIMARRASAAQTMTQFEDASTNSEERRAQVQHKETQ